ncbi:MAG: DUF3999 domain-containing protein [Myxococcales bacterium]|nr:DUF3999 domain-containing protein [Myxococcales bacterium]
MRPRLALTLSMLAIGSIARPALAEQDPAPPLQLSDFAYNQALTPAPDRALQTVLIPIEVYRGALRKSLADVRVFDLDGNEVPHAIRTLAAPTASPRSSQSLPIFPLKEAAGGEAAGDLTIHIERDADGEVIDIQSAAPRAPGDLDGGAAPARRIVSYILDARGVEDPIVKLSVTIPDARHDYVLPVRVESSNDLEQWRAVPTEAPLAQLDFQGNRIDHNELVLAPIKAKYLRLSWADQELPAPITKVVAETQPKEERAKRVSLDVLGQPVRGEPGVYLFDAGGFVPADSVHVRLLEENTLVKAELASSDDENGPWDRALHGRIYRIVENGRVIQQPVHKLTRRAPRFWRLEITAGEKELGRRFPILTLSFFPDQLLFVSRGAAEHLLAYGSYKASAPDFDTSDLIELTRRGSDEPLPRATATLGPQQPAGGAAALEEPPPPPPIRTYVLWAVLILAAVLLGVLAIRLLRQQR